jgi:hypothetical protein
MASMYRIGSDQGGVFHVKHAAFLLLAIRTKFGPKANPL